MNDTHEAFMKLQNIIDRAGAAIDGISGAHAPAHTQSSSSSGALGALGDVFAGGEGPLSSVFDIIGAGSFGCMLNEGLDTMGLPDWVGDVAGGVLDFATGNYVGVAANALDAAEDLAKACGSDELAGFLKAGANITGMLSAGPLGAAGSLGKAADTLNTIDTVTDVITQGQSVLDHAQQGDWLGAATGVLGMIGAHAGLGAHLGMEPEQIARLTDVATRGHELSSWLDHATEDGSIGLDDLLAAVGTQFGDEATRAALDSIGPLLHSIDADPEGAHSLVTALAAPKPADAVPLTDILGGNLRLN